MTCKLSWTAGQLGGEAWGGLEDNVSHRVASCAQSGGCSLWRGGEEKGERGKEMKRPFWLEHSQGKKDKRQSPNLQEGPVGQARRWCHLKRILRYPWY